MVSGIAMATVAGLQGRGGGCDNRAPVLLAYDPVRVTRRTGRRMVPDYAPRFIAGSFTRISLSAGFSRREPVPCLYRRMNSGAQDKRLGGSPSQPARTGSDALVPEGKGGEIASSVPAEARVQTGRGGIWIAGSVPTEARVQTGHSGTWIASSVPAEVRARAPSAYEQAYSRAYRAYLGATPAAGDPTASPLSAPTECPGTPPCGDPFTDVCGQTQPPDEDQCVKCRMSCPNGACCTLTEVKTYKYVYDRLHSWESGASNCFCLDNDNIRCHESEFCEGKLKHHAYKAEATTRKVGVCGGLLTTYYDAPETYKEEKWCGNCCELYPQCVVCYPIGWQEGCSGCDVDLTIPRTRVQVDRYNPCTPAVGCRADCCTQQECQACI
jgi:hypothetical protein